MAHISDGMGHFHIEKGRKEMKINDLWDMRISAAGLKNYAAGLDAVREFQHYENAARMFIMCQISLEELVACDDETLGAILTAA